MSTIYTPVAPTLPEKRRFALHCLEDAGIVITQDDRSTVKHELSFCTTDVQIENAVHGLYTKEYKSIEQWARVRAFHRKQTEAYNKMKGGN